MYPFKDASNRIPEPRLLAKLLLASKPDLRMIQPRFGVAGEGAHQRLPSPAGVLS
jgi:hypothetical protein